MMMNLHHVFVRFFFNFLTFMLGYISAELFQNIGRKVINIVCSEKYPNGIEIFSKLELNRGYNFSLGLEPKLNRNRLLHLGPGSCSIQLGKKLQTYIAL